MLFSLLNHVDTCSPRITNSMCWLHHKRPLCVTEWWLVAGSSVLHLLRLLHISLLPSFPHKKREIKLDPPVAAAGASPPSCDSMTCWLSSWHPCPPAIIPPLHAYFLLSFLCLTQLHLLSGLVSLLLWVVGGSIKLEISVRILMTLDDSLLLHKVLFSGLSFVPSHWELPESTCQHSNPSYKNAG